MCATHYVYDFIAANSLQFLRYLAWCFLAISELAELAVAPHEHG
jgi:hypothetical protein